MDLEDLRESAEIGDIEDLDIEGCIERLEEVTKAMEQHDIKLNEALALYERGTALITRAMGILREAEQRVLVLKEGLNGEFETEPFKGERED